MADKTLTELIDLLSELFTNMNNLDKTCYDMFFNVTPMDITLERYDENHILKEYVIPNRAKDKDSILFGNEEPEGNVPASIGKFYINLTDNSMYYKTQGTVLAPTSSGWELVFTSANSNNYFQVKSEKGIANGYTPLDENRKVSKEYLPLMELAFYNTGRTCTVSVELQTILSILSSNQDLVLSNLWTGTKDTKGIETITLSEVTEVTYPLNTEIATATGAPVVELATGIMTGFTSTDYLSVPLYGTEVMFGTGANIISEEIISSVGDNVVKIHPSETTLTVVPSNSNLTITNNYTGTKSIGTEVKVLTYKDLINWHTSICTIQGDLDITTGIVSGFANLDYLAPTCSWNSSATLKIKFITGTDITTPQVLVGTNMSVAIKNGYLGYNKLADQEFAQVVAITPNTAYYLKVTYDSVTSTNVVSYSTDGELWTALTPAESGGIFLLNSYAIGKGSIDGQDNVVFLGSIDTMASSVTISETETEFSTMTHEWRNESNAIISLVDYDLAVSGTPINNDILTLTYVTTKPKLGDIEISGNTEYRFKWDNSNIFDYTPKIIREGEWVPVGDTIKTEATSMNLFNGSFNGYMNLINTTNVSSNITYDENFTKVDSTGVLTYTFNKLGGFTANSNITIPVPVGKEITLVVDTGAISGTQTLVNNMSNASLVIVDGIMHFICNSVDSVTNLATITANTLYYFRFTLNESLTKVEFSTDNVVWTVLEFGGVTDFSELLKGELIQVGAGFSGSLNVTDSFTMVDGFKVPLCTISRADATETKSLAITDTKYKWYNDEDIVDLINYGVEIVGGNPSTGDRLTLTYTTTEKQFT